MREIPALKAKGGKKVHKKIAAKTGGVVHQWDVMRSMGMSPEEILPFVDALHWLAFFPPKGKEDLVKFGTGIDFRRSFMCVFKLVFY
ncbi:hypothetical protein T492DRAFT_865608 [Pavlovales sp. CCMP2436]|nr:hypothetical protein T492DRAFT_865608 [Pavlovales sp. CCMP2436]